MQRSAGGLSTDSISMPVSYQPQYDFEPHKVVYVAHNRNINTWEAVSNKRKPLEYYRGTGTRVETAIKSRIYLATPTLGKFQVLVTRKFHTSSDQGTYLYIAIILITEWQQYYIPR